MSDWQLPPVDPPQPWEPRLSGDAADPPGTPPVEGPTPPSPAAAVLPVPRRSPGASGPVSPLRAVAGAGVAVAGVLLGIGALLWATDAPHETPTVQAPTAQSEHTTASGQRSASGSTAASAVASPVRPSPTRAAPAVVPKLPLTVLNNSTRSGLADRAAARFRAGGWPIKLTGNFRGRVEATTVYYAPGELASAQLLQKSFSGLVRVRPRFATLPGSGLTVVLTRDFPA